jgi:hypothetical protein
MKKSYAAELKEGPIFNLDECPYHADTPWKLTGKGGMLGDKWITVGLFSKRIYAMKTVKALTVDSRPPKKSKK